MTPTGLEQLRTNQKKVTSFDDTRSMTTCVFVVNFRWTKNALYKIFHYI